MRSHGYGLLGALGAVLLAGVAHADAKANLAKLQLPAGFSIEVIAEVPKARQMALGEDGTLYVGSRASKASGVYAVKNGRTIKIDDGLEMPSGVAYRDGDLYVATVSQILRYPKIGAKLDSPPEPEIVTDGLPKDRHHGWKFIDFGPDGKLYVPVGAPCNVCLAPTRLHSTILRMDVKQTKPEFEVFAQGVRNSVGFDWDPTTGELWFTDNGRDMLGDGIPPDELNHAPKAGLHFGFPHFHGGDIQDPEPKHQKGKASDYVAPAQKLGPHVAALGMTFYTGTQFPAEYRNQILVPEHGSWNRTPEAGHTGYRVMRATVRDNKVVAYEPFITGWLGKDNKWWGRPVSTLVTPDGSLLISDDDANVIYRVTYKEPGAGKPTASAK